MGCSTPEQAMRAVRRRAGALTSDRDAFRHRDGNQHAHENPGEHERVDEPRRPEEQGELHDALRFEQQEGGAHEEQVHVPEHRPERTTDHANEYERSKQDRARSPRGRSREWCAPSSTGTGDRRWPGQGRWRRKRSSAPRHTRATIRVRSRCTPPIGGLPSPRGFGMDAYRTPRATCSPKRSESHGSR